VYRSFPIAAAHGQHGDQVSGRELRADCTKEGAIRTTIKICLAAIQTTVDSLKDAECRLV